MKKTKTQKGITLIALIITIIVLLILGVVVIDAVRKGGIQQYAQNARIDYTDAASEEQDILDDLEEKTRRAAILAKGGVIWEDNGDGTFTATNGMKVSLGDYVDYTYEASTAYFLSKAHSGYTSDQSIPQTTDLKWRVLGVSDKGELELISEKATSDHIYLQGATGYNNGVYLLNDICESQYSNKELGIKARSLTIEDIEKRYTEEGMNKRNTFSSSCDGAEYGKTKSYGSGYNSYPTLYAEEVNSGVTGTVREGGIGLSDPFYKNKESLSIAYDESGVEVSTSQATASGDLVVTQTEYDWSYDLASFVDNTVFSDEVIGYASNYTWLASRFVASWADNVNFGLYNMLEKDLWNASIYSSTGEGWELNGVLRPVITLSYDFFADNTDSKNNTDNKENIDNNDNTDNNENTGNNDNSEEIQIISTAVNCEKYYADVDGDKEPDGIIYLDKVNSKNSGNWKSTSGTYTSYSFEKVTTGLKEYYISKTSHTTEFGTAPVLSVVPNSTGEERFYVMALEDVNKGTMYCWYDAAYKQISDYSTITSQEIGAGKTNSENMKAKWSSSAYGPQNDNSNYLDVWGEVEEGWYIPSKKEWTAFAVVLNITTDNYEDLGLSQTYWTSSLGATYGAYMVSMHGQIFFWDWHINYEMSLRLGTNF